MIPILRFIQLLCENHNLYLQNLLRDQNNKTKYNLISDSLLLLDTICGSTTGGLGLLGLYINEGNTGLINQLLQTLTEYCQVKKSRKLFYIIIFVLLCLKIKIILICLRPLIYYSIRVHVTKTKLASPPTSQMD